MVILITVLIYITKIHTYMYKLGETDDKYANIYNAKNCNGLKIGHFHLDKRLFI